MQHALCCLLCLLLILTLIVPVSAANESGWVELLESCSIQSNGENWFTISGTSGTVTIPVYREMRLRKIDILLWNPTGQRPSAASVTVNGSTTNLDVLQIGSNLCRVVGYVPNTWYESVTVSLTKSSSASATYEVLSCKVTPLGVQEFSASGTVFLDGTHYPFSQLITAAPRSGGTQYGQIAILVDDWRKYDRISIWGSAEDFIFTSFRPSISTSGLTYELSYLSATPTGEWVEVYTDVSGYYWPGEYQGEYEGHENTEGYTQISTDGKYLFCLTIDLSSCDRSLTDSLVLYITGLFMGQVGYTFNCQYVNGQVDTADTSQVSWKIWGNDLLDSVNSLPERFAEEMGKLFQPSEGKLESVQQQSQELAEERLGAVYQAGQVVDGLVGAFQNQTATEFLTVPVLTVPLGEVDWTIGGWTVQVVPDAFKPIVEILKTVIDIVCTLAFVKSMRNRFERMLVGGNA